MPTKRSRRISNYEELLSAPGEVAIGAYARQQRRQRIALGLFGLLLIAGAIGLYLYFAPTVSDVDPTSYRAAMSCSKCRHAESTTLAAGTTLPLVCPKCKERTFWPLWQCRDCGHTFESAGRPDGSCPRCGSRRSGSATPAPR